MEQGNQTEELAVKGKRRLHSCFIILSQGSQSDNTLKEAIHGAARDAGFSPISQERFSSEIRPSLLKELGAADVVIGDITDKNPNGIQIHQPRVGIRAGQARSAYPGKPSPQIHQR
jgi:hypothetical protein